MRPVKGAPKSLWVCLRSWSLEHKSFLLPSCPLVEHAAHHALNVADGREHWLSLRNMPDQDDDWTSWTKFSTIHSDRSTLIISPDGSEIPIGQRIQWWSNSYGKKKMAQRRDLTKAYCGRWMGVVKETHSIKNQIKQTTTKTKTKTKTSQGVAQALMDFMWLLNIFSRWVLTPLYWGSERPIFAHDDRTGTQVCLNSKALPHRSAGDF